MTARHLIRRVGTSAALTAALIAGTNAFPASLKATTIASLGGASFCGYLATLIEFVQHLGGPLGSFLLKWLLGISGSYCG